MGIDRQMKRWIEYNHIHKCKIAYYFTHSIGRLSVLICLFWRTARPLPGIFAAYRLAPPLPQPCIPAALPWQSAPCWGAIRSLRNVLPHAARQVLTIVISSPCVAICIMSHVSGARRCPTRIHGTGAAKQRSINTGIGWRRELVELPVKGMESLEE